jgi:hypothetical protein
MALTLKKINPVELRSVGLDERWLQDRLATYNLYLSDPQ